MSDMTEQIKHEIADFHRFLADKSSDIAGLNRQQQIKRLVEEFRPLEDVQLFHLIGRAETAVRSDMELLEPEGWDLGLLLDALAKACDERGLNFAFR